MIRIRYLPVLLAIVAALLPGYARGADSGVPYEYWIDDAPDVPDTGRTVADSTEFTLPIGNLSPGLHTLYARAYEGDRRGPLMQQLFVTAGTMSLGGYEYWLNDDFANRRRVSSESGDINLDVSIGHLKPGLHTLYMRCNDTDGKGGPLYQQLFVTVGSMKLGGYEYWIDDNYAKRQNVRNTSGTIALDVPIKGLKPGLHTLYMRCSDTEGRGGSLFQQLFLTSGYMEFGGYEYWLDDDYTKRQFVSESSPTVNFNVSLDKLKPGLHTLYMRCSDPQGNAGPLFQQLFVTVGSMKLGDYEYWLDDDIESRKKIPNSEGVLAFDVPIDHLRPGLHSLFIRCSDTSGGGGPLFQQLFVISGKQQVQGVEYWFDDNYASAVTLSSETVSKLFTIPTDGLKGGIHMLNFRTISTSGMRGTLSQSMILLDDTYHKSIAGYRYRIEDKEGYETVTPPNGAEQQAYVLPSPEWKLPSLDEIAASLSFEDTEVTMNCGSEAEVMVQFHTQDGRWLAPVTDTITREAPMVEAAELRPFSTLALEKPDANSLTAFRIEMSEEATYWLRGSQDADVYVDRENAGEPGRWFTPAELRDGIQLDLTPGRWFGVLVNVPVNEANADSSIELRLNDTPGNMTPAPKINVSATDSSARVEITCTNPTAEIWYTLDGAEPEQNVSTRYEAPFSVDRNLTIQARAYTADFEPSAIVREEIRSFKAPRPILELQGYRLVMATDRANDSIYYTLDNTDPRDRSRATLYAGTFDLPQQSLKVRAVTVRDGWNDSDEESLDFNVEEHLVDMPRISRATDGLVVMECATAGASIRYTTDGSDPTAASTLYESPITPTGNMTFKARAFRDGMYPSVTVTFEVNDLTVPTPEITNVGLIVTIKGDRETDAIHYTIDGTDPTANSPRYSAPLTMPEQDVTVKAIAVRANWYDSPVATYEFMVADHKVATPSLALDSEGRVTMACATAGAEIRFTMDGSDPTGTSTIYESPIAPAGNMTFKAKAFKDEMFASAVSSITVSDMMTPSPTISNEGLTVTMSADREMDAIHYTIDGSEPTANSLLYSSPLTMPEQDVTLKAIAVRANWNDSPVATYEFKVADHKVATPALALDGEGRVTMTCATDGAVIRYTTNGNDPTENSEVYTAPIAPTGNMTFKAKAFKADMFASAVASITVSDMMTPSPKITNEGLTVTIRADRETDAIHYTLDGTEPTAESPRYSTPLTMPEQDVTVKAIAVRANWNDSPVATYEFKVTDHKVATPSLALDGEGRVTMACATPGAEIRFTMDGSDPTGTSTIYESPIAPTGNMTFKAKAFKADMFASAVASITVSDMMTPSPKITNEGLTVTMSADRETDAIHYTLDGTEPTASSPRYSAPLTMTEQDVTVKAIAVRENWNDSPVATYEFKVADHKVATPTLSLDGEGRVTMSCATDGAVIRYTTNGNDPTEDSEAYTDPITPTGNMTFKARAFKADMFASAVNSLTISELTVATPSAKYEAHTIILTAGNEADSVLYVINGDVTGDEPALYTGPIPVESDCTVSFIGRRAGYNDSPAGEFRFVLSDWKMAEPEFEPHYLEGRLLLSANAPIHLNVDGEESVIESGYELTMGGDFTVTGIAAATIATDANHYDSDTVTFTPEYEIRPELRYDGQRVWIENGILCEIVGSDMDESGYIEGYNLYIPRLFTIDVRGVSETRFPSDVVTLSNMAYFNAENEEAGCREAGYIADAFAWADTSDLEAMERIAVAGKPGDLDFMWLRDAMPDLREVDLGALTVNVLPAGLLSGYEMLESVTLPGMLTECAPIFGDNPRLTSIFLTGPLPEGVIGSADNPNLLILTPEMEWAPEDARLVATGEGDNYIIEDLPLEDGRPFYTPVNLTARHASLTREFNQQTPDPEDKMPKARGWESIAVPFDVERITHSTQGEIKPFAAIAEDDNRSKPFWLYRADDEGDWMRAATIEGGRAYIISMPEHEHYLPQYRLGGSVTFSADNVTITPEVCEGNVDTWRDGREFVATFMPLNEEESVTAMGLNVGMADDTEDGTRLLPGSTFLAEVEVKPFTGYATRMEGENYLPLWPGESAMPVLSEDAGLLIEAVEGGLRLTSSTDRKVVILTTTGLKIDTLNLHGGESRTLSLSPAIYIVAGCKVEVH